jgi:para-nitrobenzyl esterase
MGSVGVSSARLQSLRQNLLVCSILLAGFASAPALAAGSDDGPVVKTIEGRVRGFTKNGVDEFLGIPYAAPPVGKLRWMPPQPVKKWHDTLDATHYGNTCPQVTELGAFAGPTSITEDCLYLNVFTTGKGKKKPVIVWIHGGGNVDGESDDYDGSKLATGGALGTPTVVVTLNYRMGLFGFLSEAHLNAEGHPFGNYAILDQQAVLRWVQRNIAAFGGDPTKVTLGGQSAGARDTAANLVSPLAAGLFQRAITQSYPIPSFGSGSAALLKGNAFAAAAGCSSAACLRKLSAARILQIQGTPNANAIDPTIKQSYTTTAFVDGTIVPIQAETAWTTGRYNHMPIMGGSVNDEQNFFTSITEYFSGPPQVALTPAQYTASNNATVLAQYPLSSYDNNPTEAQNRVSTDQTLCQNLHVLKAQAASNKGYGVYGYVFAYQHAPYYFPQMSNAYDSTGHFQPLAYHTADIQFVFPGWHGGNLGVNLDQTTGQPRELQGSEVTLSDQLVAAWTNFAKSGNPNGSGNSPWPKFKANAPTFFQQNTPNTTESEAQYRANYKCDFWDSILTYPTN